ncbi:methionyl-tRNA formyltransferase [Acaryochloris sp. IP29b_bin.137]|uniref:methionyl-tRNA formyltransferase n=1 Tax=Acaryochloris sp. IP29b_bin.137 TaxID=2969217 RepID=UPI00344E26BC
MKLIYWGTPQFAVPSLERLLQEPNFEVVGVVTQPDKRRGRGGKVSPSPVKEVAVAAGLPIWQSQNIKADQTVLAELRSHAVDAFVVVAYGQILSPEILAMPRLGCINSHGSLLPKYRGAAPIQWGLYYGEPRAGITTMLMDEGMDTGDMLLRQSIEVGLLENAMDVAIRLADLSGETLVKTLGQLEQDRLSPVPQNVEEATYAPLITKSDFQLDWSKSAIALHNQIRGFAPNCVTQFRGTSLKVMASAPLGQDYVAALPDELATLAQGINLSLNLTSGSIVHLAPQQGPIIQTGDGLLLLRSVQLAGKRRQSGGDFVNGVRLSVGEVLGEKVT